LLAPSTPTNTLACAAARDVPQLAALRFAAGVAIAGLIGFVGLIVPHCVRLVVGPNARIVLPLSVPGLVAGGVFAFIATWNNFLFAYLFTTTDSVKTLPVIMRLFALGEPAVWGTSAAGALLTTLPVVLLFLLFQRMLISGLAAGAVKG